MQNGTAPRNPDAGTPEHQRLVRAVKALYAICDDDEKRRMLELMREMRDRNQAAQEFPAG